MEQLTATLTVAAPAERVFAVLADPTMHSAIDGTGWVRQAVNREPLTAEGQIFRVDMYHPNAVLDGNYRMANKVNVFVQDRAIGWIPGQEKDGELTFGGWTWRYDLTPDGPSTSTVTLTYDWSAVPQAIREHIGFPPFGAEHLSNSLEHLAELAAASVDAVD